MQLRIFSLRERRQAVVQSRRGRSWRTRATPPSCSRGRCSARCCAPSLRHPAHAVRRSSGCSFASLLAAARRAREVARVRAEGGAVRGAGARRGDRAPARALGHVPGDRRAADVAADGHPVGPHLPRARHLLRSEPAAREDRGRRLRADLHGGQQAPPRDAHPRRAPRSRIVYHGLDLSRFSPQPRVARPGPPRVLGVGSLLDVQGLRHPDRRGRAAAPPRRRARGHRSPAAVPRRRSCAPRRQAEGVEDACASPATSRSRSLVPLYQDADLFVLPCRARAALGHPERARRVARVRRAR